MTSDAAGLQGLSGWNSRVPDTSSDLPSRLMCARFERIDGAAVAWSEYLASETPIPRVGETRPGMCKRSTSSGDIVQHFTQQPTNSLWASEFPGTSCLPLAFPPWRGTVRLRPSGTILGQ
jgi:hypothetical protein